MQEPTLPPFSEPKQPPKVQKTLKESRVSIPKDKLIRKPSDELKTPLIYRGGKSAISSWVISYFPPHYRFVDVFGGGAAISIAKNPSGIDIYNDIGDVARFFEVLRDYGDEVYSFLTFYPFGRYTFKSAITHRELMYKTIAHSWNIKEYEEPNRFYKVRWAAFYYISVLQSFRHEEGDTSWIISKDINLAEHFANHVDDFPRIIDRLRRVVIEHMDFRSLIEMYDGKDTLFYCDPPYLPDTWTSGHGSYEHEMSEEQHRQLLCMIQACDAQVVVSGYPSDLYDEYLHGDFGWIRVEKERVSGIKNASQSSSSRMEVLWIKRKQDELWS